LRAGVGAGSGHSALSTGPSGALPRAGGSRSLAGRRALGAADHAEQGFNLAADGGIVRTFDRAGLNDGEVEIASVDIDEFKR
jgi:hypothetical protein